MNYAVINPATGETEKTFETLDDAGRFSRARLFPLRASGAAVDTPILAPTQQNLDVRPSPCPAGERSATPRVVTHYSPGTRHPVVVSDAVDPPRSMITSGAVLHGTPDSACAAAFEIEPVVERYRGRGAAHRVTDHGGGATPSFADRSHAAGELGQGRGDAAAAAVPGLIECDHGVARGAQRVGDRREAERVVGPAVREQHVRLRRGIAPAIGPDRAAADIECRLRRPGCAGGDRLLPRPA